MEVAKVLGFVLMTFCLGQPSFQQLSRSMPDHETSLNNHDFQLAATIVENPGVDPLESGSYFEGDINLKGKSILEYTNQDSETDENPLMMRNAVRDPWRKWPNGRIPYAVSSRFSRNDRARIAAAISEYHKRTCVRFVKRTPSDRNYLYITIDDGCYSEVGRTGGRQYISLDNGCLYKGIVLHELMHTVGFFHEQSRADRDQYVTIEWKNIRPGADDQFQKYSLRTIDQLGVPYDYSSIMHYSKRAFTRNGRATIVPKEPGVQIGQRRDFSTLDLKKINLLYKCDKNNNNVVKPITPKPVLPNTNNGCRDKLPDCPTKKYRCGFDSRVQLMCPATCGFCRNNVIKPITATPRPILPVWPVKGSCSRDTHPKCSDWASRGYCKLRFISGFMKRQCCVSCRNA